jgi:hypothetical protein
MMPIQRITIEALPCAVMVMHCQVKKCEDSTVNSSGVDVHGVYPDTLWIRAQKRSSRSPDRSLRSPTGLAIFEQYGFKPYQAKAS